MYLCGMPRHMLLHGLLNSILIYYYQAMGAAIASVVAECAVTAAQFIVVRRELKFTRVLRIFARYAVLTAIMGAVGLIAAHFAPSGILGIAVIAAPCVVVYGAMLLLLRDPVFAFFKNRNG